MRIPMAELTETIRAEVERVQGLVWTPTTGATPEHQRAVQLAGKRNLAARIPGLTALLVYPVVVMAAVIGVIAATDVSPLWALGPGALGAVPLYYALPGRKGLTVGELRAYLPLMSLSPVESAYVEAVAEAYDSDADASLRGEILPPMRRLAEESARLDRLEATLSEVSSSVLWDEVDEMRARLASLSDAGAREAMLHAIATAERRLASSISEGDAHERIEAHRAMIRQSALAARETLRRLRLTPENAGTATDLDLSALRASAEGAGREVAALEAAVQEMRAL